ncbi:MAG: phytanoyl-CoA dioxygenase family protein [Planctomycetota bacterium]|nr:phytanoyl-CoA dioxygenase family protein [Planctomycetota bacterium]
MTSMSTPYHPSTHAAATSAVPITADDVASYEEEGYVIIRRLFDPALAAEVRERVDGMLAGRYPSEGFKCGRASDQRPDDPGRMIFQVMPAEFPIRDPVLRAFAENANLLDAARRLLRRTDVRMFQQQALVKEPGAANAIPWHQDDHYWRTGERGSVAVTAWTPLLPATAANGTMWLLPASHRQGLQRHGPAGGVSLFQTIVEPIDDSRLVPLELDPGDVSFHHPLTIHGAPPNTGRLRRVGFAQHYWNSPP